MASEAKQGAFCSIIKKFMGCSIRTIFRCVSKHRALFSATLVLYLICRSSPSFFAFLLSNYPVIICTAILLGVLLSNGSPQLPEIDEGRKAPEEIAPKSGISCRNFHIEASQMCSVPAMENIIREASFGRANSSNRIDLCESVPLLTGVEYQGANLERILASEKESKDAVSSKDKGKEYANLSEDGHQSKAGGKETTFDMYSSSESIKKDAEMVMNPNHQEGLFTDSQRVEVEDASKDKAVDGAAGKCRWGRAFSVRQRKKLADIKVEAINSVVDNQSEHFLCSPRVGGHDNLSGFDPDHTESFSPDDSMTDTGPVANETRALLGADFSCPNHVANSDSNGQSNMFCQESRADSDSNELAENSKAKDDGEEKKDARNEPAFLWTADDEKNVMDLGYLEVERSRRLEIMMVKRKSMKNIRFEIDEVGGVTGDLSRSRSQVRPISVSAPRMNPFADDTEMPGSAPPILHLRKNPFGFLTKQSHETGVPASHDQEDQEFIPASHQDTLFKRHESFNFDRPPQRPGSRLKPCSDEAGTSSFQRQFSDRSVCRLSVVSECDTVSSIGDQEHNDFIRNYIRGVRESPGLLGQDGDLVYTGAECSDGIGLVDNEAVSAIIC